MRKKIEDLIKEYELLIALCKADLESDMNTENLEAYIKGKKSAYERLIPDLEKLLNECES